MAKGYWIARVDVHDPEGYKDYVATAKPAFERFGAKFLARGGPYTARRERRAAATSSSNSTRSRPPRPATTRRNTRPPAP